MDVDGCGIAVGALSSRTGGASRDGHQNGAVFRDAQAEPAPAANSCGTWELVWADEFDKEGRPDSRNWTYERGFIRNKELQWYQPENAWCENGLLIIEARREEKPNPYHDPESTDWRLQRNVAHYTSASLRTEALHSWQFGRFVMRSRIDTRSGLWPSFWTMGARGEWPACGEVDIMEYYNGTLLANVAWGTSERWTPQWDSAKIPLAKLGDGAWVDHFHVWRMDWNEDAIQIFVDDRLLNTTDLRQTVNGNKEARNPFHQPHFLLLNLAIGGTNGGDPSSTKFPARFAVDYVRVFQQRK